MLFRKWLLINESTYEYVVPSDKEQQLYDFYMITFLRGRSQFDVHSGKVGFNLGASIVRPNPEEMDEEDKIDYELDQAAKTLFPKLKENLLEAVYFSLLAEFRHVFDKNESEDLIDFISQVSDEFVEIFKQYAQNFVLLSSRETKKFQSLPKIPIRKLFNRKDSPEDLGDNSRLTSYQAAVKIGVPQVQFVKMMKYFYESNDISWNQSYGGPAWANICAGWIDLYNAKRLNQMAVQIDHIYDLQHNTGSVLNKVRSYMKGGKFDWLKVALDHKAKIKSPHELIHKISPNFRKIAFKAIKMKTGKSYEDFLMPSKSSNAKDVVAKSSELSDFPVGGFEKWKPKYIPFTEAFASISQFEGINFVQKIARFLLTYKQKGFESIVPYVNHIIYEIDKFFDINHDALFASIKKTFLHEYDLMTVDNPSLILDKVYLTRQTKNEIEDLLNGHIKQGKDFLMQSVKKFRSATGWNLESSVKFINAWKEKLKIQKVSQSHISSLISIIANYDKMDPGEGMAGDAIKGSRFVLKYWRELISIFNIDDSNSDEHIFFRIIVELRSKFKNKFPLDNIVYLNTYLALDATFNAFTKANTINDINNLKSRLNLSHPLQKEIINIIHPHKDSLMHILDRNWGSKKNMQWNEVFMELDPILVSSIKNLLINGLGWQASITINKAVLAAILLDISS